MQHYGDKYYYPKYDAYFRKLKNFAHSTRRHVQTFRPSAEILVPFGCELIGAARTHQAVGLLPGEVKPPLHWPSAWTTKTMQCFSDNSFEVVMDEMSWVALITLEFLMIVLW